MADEVITQAAPLASEEAAHGASTPTETPTAAPPKEPPSRHDLLRQAFNKAPSERGKHAAQQPRSQGRFAGPPAPSPAAASSTVPPAAPVIPHPEMPKSLKQELKDHWTKTPREIAEAVVQRELDSQRGVAQMKERAAQADDLLNEFKPYELLLKTENTSPKAAISELLKTAAILRTGTPAQKAQAVAVTMQQFGIPIEHIHQMLTGNGQQPVLNPQFSQISQEVQQLKQSLTQQQQQRQEEEQARSLAAIQAFASDPAHQYFDAVQDTMLSVLQSPQLLGDATTFDAPRKLKAAYDIALKLQGLAPPPPQQAAQQQAQQVSQARAAAVQVTGAPSPAPAQAVNPNDRRALIANAFRRGA